MNKKDTFRTNPHKASARVAINSFMSAAIFLTLSIIWLQKVEKEIPIIIIVQLVFAIPLLFVSSLAYSKIGYYEEVRHWEKFAWILNNLGNIFVLNVVGIFTKGINQTIALLYFVLTILLMLVYTTINIILNRHTIRERIFKFLFFVTVLFLMGILPVIY